MKRPPLKPERRSALRYFAREAATVIFPADPSTLFFPVERPTAVPGKVDLVALFEDYADAKEFADRKNKGKP